MALVGKTQRKRAWGKPSGRSKISVIENMDLQVPDKPKTINKMMEDGKSSSQGGKHSEWMHPEILSTERLRELLTDMRVEIDGLTVREELVHLFRKYLLPRPQRKRCKRDRHQQAVVRASLPLASTWCDNMEWEGICSSDAPATAAADCTRLASHCSIVHVLHVCALGVS